MTASSSSSVRAGVVVVVVPGAGQVTAPPSITALTERRTETREAGERLAADRVTELAPLRSRPVLFST